MCERTRAILNNLQAVSEDVLALSDDIWLNIDHNDSAAVMRGAEFKVAFNDAVLAFSQASNSLVQLVENFTQVGRFEAPVAPRSSEERELRERIIQRLDQRVPHTLAEDFTFKRPAAFTLAGVPFDGTSTWSQVYETLCRHLASINPRIFEALPDNPDFISSRGNKAFSRNPSDLRISRDFGHGVLAEMNLSANQIRDWMKRLLDAFELPVESLAIYLREDRDAG